MTIKLPLIFFLLLFLAGNGMASDLINFYKKGTVQLKADPAFGSKTDWESIFFDMQKELCVSPDGTIFVSNSRQHKIMAFSKAGNRVKTFGRKGRGPGDLYYPTEMTILDNKYLVVAEYASTRRISLFDLSGKYVKVLKTNHSVYMATALKSNKVAYLSYKYKDRNTIYKRTTQVIIKDVGSSEERVATSYKIVNKSYIRTSKNGVIALQNFIGEVFISKTGDGNLLVGVSNSPEIKIFSPDGKLNRSFQLKMTPVSVTDDYVSRFKARKLNYYRKAKGSRLVWMGKKLKAVDFKTLFAKHLPYYRKIIVDSEGNILVFKWTGCQGDCPTIFQVYSPNGDYICETRLKNGIFDYGLSRSSGNIVFTNKGIFGLFQLKDSDDVSLRLVKVNLK